MNLFKKIWKARTDKEAEKFISGAARQYPEVLLEAVNNERRNDKRKEIVRNSGAEYVISFLKKVPFDTSYFMNQIALLEAGYWSGSPVSSLEVRVFLTNV